jgi:shikimate dehydrogenase
MHESAARALGIELRYDRFAVEPSALAEAVRQKHAEGIDGYNLTVPHKQAIMELLDEVAPSAAAIGAVNTVVHSGDRYVGHNTDAPGFVRSLVDAGVTVPDSRTVILGAGGAARAAVVGLAEAEARHIVVLSRRPEQSEALISSLGALVDCGLEAAPFSDAAEHFGAATLLVQATSATLGSNPRAQEFADSLPIDALPSNAAVVDMVYDPLRTTLLERAAQRSLVTVDGLGMLLHQGAIAFEMWTGFEAPIDVMRDAIGA